jgi:HlyD family secretion protein
MRTILKRAVWALLAILAVVATVILVRPSPLGVESARVVSGSMQTTVNAEGKTRVRDRFILAAPVTGRLMRIRFQRGDQVNRDAIIARIDPLPLSLLDPRQLAEARARVAAAESLRHEAAALVEQIRAGCEQAQREMQRAEKLVETGDLSRQDFERTRNTDRACQRQLEAATFKARAAASEVDVASASLIAVEHEARSGEPATAEVRAPSSGKVLRVIEENERVVMAGTLLLELSNHALEVVVETLSNDAVKIQPGMMMLIEGWGGDRTIRARVRLTEPSGFTKISALGVEEQRVNVIADFVDPPDPLGDGYRVEARIIIWEKHALLKTPSSALFRRGQKWNVFVVQNGVLELREVEVGHRDSADAEVLAGLKEGEMVILHPSNQVTEGLRVKANHP